MIISHILKNVKFLKTNNIIFLTTLLIKIKIGDFTMCKEEKKNFKSSQKTDLYKKVISSFNEFLSRCIEYKPDGRIKNGK